MVIQWVTSKGARAADVGPKHVPWRWLETSSQARSGIRSWPDAARSQHPCQWLEECAATGVLQSRVQAFEAADRRSLCSTGSLKATVGLFHLHLWCSQWGPLEAPRNARNRPTTPRPQLAPLDRFSTHLSCRK